MNTNEAIFQAIDRYAEIFTGFRDENDTDVYTIPGKFYFWDETQAYAHGPFDTREAAQIGVDDYVRWLETGE